MSLRRRLIGTSLLTLAIGLGALLVLGNALLAVRAQNASDNLLRARADAQIAALEVTPSGLRVRDAANDAQLDRDAWIVSEGRVIERPVDASPATDRAAVNLARAGRTGAADGPAATRLYASAVRSPDRAKVLGTVVVATSTEAVKDLRQEVLIGSLVLAALVLVAGGLAIRTAVDGALRPVAEMTASAEAWGAHDLDRRFAMGPARDELTGLAATLDHLLARIAASRRHEQRFAADVAHELKTPLAAIQGRAELAASATGAEADTQRVAALQEITEASRRLDATVEALLIVARQELDPASGSVDVEALAAEFDDVQVVGSGVPRAEGDTAIVRRALAPLVENARRHARSTVTLELAAREGMVEITVRDDGPGLDPAVGERAFEPGVRGTGASSGGAGLGLPLARRLAEACGGTVSAGTGPGGCFVLRLPAV